MKIWLNVCTAKYNKRKSLLASMHKQIPDLEKITNKNYFMNNN